MWLIYKFELDVFLIEKNLIFDIVKLIIEIRLGFI